MLPLQSDDLYSSSNYALAAGMELHARLTNAWLNNKDTSMLPSGFKFYESMPAPPYGTRWQFDMKKQKWSAYYTSNGAWHSDSPDSTKYLLGLGETRYSMLLSLHLFLDRWAALWWGPTPGAAGWTVLHSTVLRL